MAKITVVLEDRCKESKDSRTGEMQSDIVRHRRRLRERLPKATEKETNELKATDTSVYILYRQSYSREE